MSVSYTSLDQGQNDDRQRSTNEHSLSVAPMANAEVDDNMEGNGNVHEGDDISNSNIPHVLVTEHNDEKLNHVGEDHFDGRVGDDEHMHLGDLRPNTPHSSVGRVPHLGLNFDTELGSLAGESIPDINVYQHKKTLAQGMMDLALFSANANQLRYVLDSYSRHPYYWPSVICISLSLGFQVAIGVGLIWNSLYNVKDEKEICIANKINNWCVIGIFLVVVINVFVSAFGVAEPFTVLPVPQPAASIAVAP